MASHPVAPGHAAPARALILAAGVGRRLGGTHDGPKALLEFGGRSLVRRHVESLRAAGVERIAIVVGFEAERFRTHVATFADGIEFIDNPEFRRGSLLSLDRGRAVLESGDDVLLMDADVLHEEGMLARLLASPHRECFLVDREIEPGDEPVKLCIRDGTIVDFAKRPDAPHEWHGESVGFFRFSGPVAAELAGRVAAMVAAGDDGEYEEAIRRMVAADPARFGWEDVTGTAWTEIDFPEDVARANALATAWDMATGEDARPRATGTWERARA